METVNPTTLSYLEMDERLQSDDHLLFYQNNNC